MGMATMGRRRGRDGRNCPPGGTSPHLNTSLWAVAISPGVWEGDYMWHVLIIILVSRLGFAFESEMFPSEYLPIITASGDSMILRGAPMTYAKISRIIKPAQGDTIKFGKVRYRTVFSGLYLARVSGVAYGAVYGNIYYLSLDDYWGARMKISTLKFAEGDILEYLQYRAERWEFWRINDHVICAEYLARDPTPFKKLPLKELRRGQWELWIQVRDNDSNSLGWYLLENEKYYPLPTTNFLPVEFKQR